jgi:DNA-binding CsgD family transcriptional regulator
VDEPFVGRAAEVAELGRQLELAKGGHGRAVLLAGPAGIGKTALIRRCLAAWATHVDALLACGDPEEVTFSGGLLGQLASSAAGTAEIAAVLASGRADPLTAGSALLAWLQEIARNTVLVVVVDDAQWGDELSLKAVSFALRRMRADRVLGVVAVRPEGLARLPPGLMRLAADHGALVELSGLDAAEVAELAELAGAGRLPGRAAVRLREHTAGVPLHIHELLHDLPGEALRTPGVTLPAPRSLETLVLSRLAACAEETERLVVAAAIFGTDCGLADAAALAGLADPLPAWQEAIGQRLLEERETAAGRRCVFPHALIRAAVYRDIGVSRRAALHRAAAGLTAGPAALAHRSAGCPGADPQLAADLAAQAAQDRSAGRLAEAAGHLLMAARAAGRGQARDWWLLEAVGILIDSGDAARAGMYVDEVAGMPPSPQRSLLLGRLAMCAGGYARAERQITDAWAALASGTPPDADRVREAAATAACQLALLLVGQHRLEEAAAWAQRAGDAAASGFIRACSRATQGGLLAAVGQADRAVVLLEAELRLCGDQAGCALLRAGLGGALMYADDLPAAAAHLDAAVTAGGQIGLPMAHLLEAGLLRVLVAYRHGDWDRAAADGERLVTLVDDLDQGWLLARAHVAAVYVAAGRGCWQAAAGHAEAAARQPGAGAGFLAIELANARAAIAVARDDPEGVLAAAQDVIGDLDRLSGLEPGLLSFWPACAQALARTGRPDQAEIMLGRFEALARMRGRRSALAAAARARGVLEAARNRPADALAAFDASLRHLRGLGMPLEEAMTLLEHGRLLRRTGQRRSAARDLGAARGLFTGLAAQPFLVRCDQELCAGPQPATGPALPLTARQLAVAQAAAAGKSNRQIAAELYISVKTVEFHLAQILARLGVDTRTQIGDALAATPASARPSARPSDAPSPHTHMRPPPGPARTRPRPRRQ